MRILMTTAHATLLDGVNRHVQVLAPALNTVTGVSLKVVTLLPPGELNRSLSENGVDTDSLNVSSIRSWKGLLRLLRLMRTFRPDVVHVETPVIMVYVAVLLFKICGSRVKIIETIHGMGAAKDAKPPRFGSRNWLYRWFRKRHDAMIYISKGVYEDRKGMVPVETYIYNPMSFREPEQPNETIQSVIGVSADVPVIGTACRIAAVKQPEAFVKVMVGVLEHCPQTHAVVLGDGPKDVVEAARWVARQSSVSSRIHFMGYRPDAKELMQSFSCFVMTSSKEGMPTALLEAISQKVPIAFWNGLGGLSDLARLNAERGPIGVVAELGDVDGLVGGICAILDNPDSAKANAECAFNVGRQTFNIEDVKMQTVAFYQKVCKVSKMEREKDE